MSRASSITNDPSLAGLSSLSGLNRQPLSPEQQLQALKRVQAQAEQRVKLGMQLFKAAEARLSTQTDMLGQIKNLQHQLREQVNQDVAKSLHEYDQWIGQIDESFTTAIRKLEEKVDAVQTNIINSEARVKHMLQRAEALLDQSRCLAEHNGLKPIDPPSSAPALMPINPIPEPTPKPIAQEPKPAPKPAMQSEATVPKPTPATEPAPQAETNTNADTHLASDSHQLHSEQEKIYSTLLQRLMQEDTAKDAADNAIEDDSPEENASAA